MPQRDPPSPPTDESGQGPSPSSSGSARPRASGSSGRHRSSWGKRVLFALKTMFFAGLFLLALGALGAFLVIRHFEANLPSISDLKGNYNPPQVTRVLARDGTLLSELFTERRTVVAIASLPPHVKLAVLAAEDAAFYEHEGLNYLGMLRAFVVNLRAGRTRQGGSTITQQVVKNLLLDPERSVRRKIREVILARRLEQQISKDEILELYLNHIYFGRGRYGIEEAARYYFGKGAREVTLAEGAMLAGLVAGPELYSPRHDAKLAENRRSFVLAQMLDKGFIDQRQHDAAMVEPLRIAPVIEPQGQLAPEVVELVKRTLKEAVGEAKNGGGYTITTTIDPKLQAAARKAVRDNLDAYDKRYRLLGPFTPPPSPGATNGKSASAKKKPKPSERPYEGSPRFADHKVFLGVVTAVDDAPGLLDIRVGTAAGTVKLADYERYNPTHLPPSQFAPVGTLLRVSLLAPVDNAAVSKVPLRLEVGPEGAMVALDVRTREVLALVGNYEAASGALDRVTQAHRQPGSSFKPFVYSYGLYARRFTAATMLDTNPGTLAGYRPSNFEDSEGNAPMRLREALAHSVNVAAVHVLQDVGPANVVSWANALGIQSKMGADLSLALGSYEVLPYEMATAYATFASGGMYATPILVTRIVAADGAEIALPQKPPPRRVMGEAEAYLTTSLLTSVVDHGTAAAARSLGRPVAGKTGTSNQAKDAWFVGYSPEIVCATWTGYDDGRPLGAREAGATAALPAWVSFMKAAHEKHPVTEFPRPPGVASARIDPRTGLRAYEGETDAFDEVFLEGTEPQETSSPDAGAPGDGGELVTGVAEDEGDAGAPRATLPAVLPSASPEDGGAALPRAPSKEEAPPF